jgi:AraC-like DNA-binding protein
MLLKDFLPGPAWRAFVRWYRIVHFEFDKAVAIPAKAYPPKPEEVLNFFLRDPFAVERENSKKEYQPPVTLVGQRTLVTKQYNGHDFLNFQIVFQPTALFRLTGIPSSELTNQFLDAECVFSTSIRSTFEQLQCAKSYSELLTIGENFVGTLVKHTRKEFHGLDAVAQHMTQSDGNVSLDWLAKEACLCTKQFKRKFNERTGVNPKTYARIIRFNKAFNIRNRYPDRDWLMIAIECGYYDYQHLVKDYKDFTGLTPSAFHLLEVNSPESVLGLTNELYRSRITLAQ